MNFIVQGYPAFAYTGGRDFDPSLPAIVFVHGAAFDHSVWQWQSRYLAHHGFTVLAMDLPAHGRSPGPIRSSIGGFADWANALLDAATLDKAILVGHSMGCRVVLEANRVLDGKVGGIVLVDGSRFATGDPEAAAQAAKAAIDRDGYAAFSRSLFGEMFVPGSARAAEILARVAAMRPDVPSALWPRSARWDAGELDGALAAVRAPVLAIQSTVRDPVTLKRTSLRPGEPSGWLELLQSKLTNVRIEVIPGVGHFTQLDAPERVNALISRFAEGSLSPDGSIGA